MFEGRDEPASEEKWLLFGGWLVGIITLEFLQGVNHMLVLICLVCVLSCFGGILLGQSLKGQLIFKQGLEKGMKKMFAIGVGSVVLAIVLSVASLLIPQG